jgi:regulatory protein
VSTQGENENYRHALNVAVRILSVRDHSLFELAHKLAKKGFSNSIIDQVIKQCDRLKYVDDHKFAENMVNMMVRKGYGRYYLQAALKRKGIDSRIIESIFEDRGFSIKEFNGAKIAMKKKIKRMKNLTNHDKRMASLYRYLQGRGFPKDLIHRLFAEQNYF